MFSTREASEKLTASGIKLDANKVAELARMHVFPNAIKDQDGRWQITESDIEGYISKRKRKNRSQFILTIGSIVTAITILSSISIIKDSLDLFIDHIRPWVNSNRHNIQIIDWDGHRSLDKLVLTLRGCQDSQRVSSILGKTPKYYVIYEASIEFTVVNYGQFVDGIVEIGIPEDGLAMQPFAQLPTWYVWVKTNEGVEQGTQLSINLPPRVPKKIELRAFYRVETQPNRTVNPISEYASALSPIEWTFTTLDEESFTHQSEFLLDVTDAVDDGLFDFSKECEQMLPRWPLPVVGIQIP